MQNNDFHFEINRKIFHLSSLILPLVYLFSSKIFIVTFLFLLTIIVIYIDIARHYNPKIKYLVEKFFAKFIRDKEKSGSLALSGASFMFLGFLISALLFPKGVAINCFLVLIICDSIAALIGMKVGSPQKNTDKTFEGSAAFFLSAVLLSLLCYNFIGYKTNFAIIIVNSFVATLVEFYSGKFSINDNLSIPLSYGLSNSLLSISL